jgi:hypothetical protein
MVSVLFSNMSSITEVKAAERSMREAQDAVRAYTERQAKQPEFNLHRQLAAELKAATDLYVQAVLDLNSR